MWHESLIPHLPRTNKHQGWNKPRSLGKYSRRSTPAPESHLDFSLTLICSTVIKLSNRKLDIKQNFIIGSKAPTGEWDRNWGWQSPQSFPCGHPTSGVSDTSKIKPKFPRHAQTCKGVALGVKYLFILILFWKPAPETYPTFENYGKVCSIQT